MKAIVLAGVLAAVLTLAGTRLAITFLEKRGFGQFIRDDLKSHQTKRGTPTMGGIVIIAAVVIAYFTAHLALWELPTITGLLVLFLFVGTGIVGFLDDWIKISKERSLGLGEGAKLAGQLIVGVLFAIGAFMFPNERGVTPASHHISFLRDLPWASLTVPGLAITGFLFAGAFIVLITLASSNAVNITDGMDGLAAGASTMVFAAYGLLNIWQFNQWCARASTASPRCYEVRDPLDTAVIAIAIAAACFGFLWWNAKPARIFMGDSGSLSLGGALAGLAVVTRTELLLIILAGLFVLETFTSLWQRIYFKATHGKRFFKMAPIHHHFEIKGWEEITIVIRFWIICGCCVAAALGLFYAEWVSGQ